MILNWLLQKDSEDTSTFENTLKEVSKKGLKKIYLVISCMKESGYKIIEEELYGFKSITKVLLGIDKKNTTKSMLEGMMNLSKDIYIFSNNNEKELETNLYIFECNDFAYVYNISGNLSEGGIKENITMYPEIIYDLSEKKDKEDYKKMKMIVEKELIDDKSKKLTLEYIDELSEKKEIFSTNLYNNYAVKSISELLKENAMPNNVVDDEEKPNLKEDVKKIDLSDKKNEVNIDLGNMILDETENKKSKETVKSKSVVIDISDVAQPIFDDDVRENITKVQDLNEEEKINFEDLIIDDASDLEHLIFEQPSIQIQGKKIEIVKKEKIEENNENKKVEDELTIENKSKIKTKKIDLNKVTNLIIQLPKLATKGRDKDAIKIPSYIKDLIPHFFSLSEKGNNISDESGIYKVIKITLEIINVENGDKFKDESAKIVQRQGQTYLTICSDFLSRIVTCENDIARIIKLSDDIYRCEIVSQNLKEYELWQKMCSQKFKGVNRCYGVM